MFKIMKIIRSLPVILLTAAMIVSACGAPAEPTINALDVQNTAVAAAFTVVAETQAAIPTATPLPPTETPSLTPLPTNTQPPLPTIQATATTVVDPCDTRVLSWSPKGQKTKIRILNTTKAAVTVSLYLNETRDHNECGYRSYNLSGRSDVLISDLVQGCYNLWAFNSDPKTPVNASSPTSCINNGDKWTFEIGKDFIRFIGP
jgi:hypothetical protein